MPSSAGVNAATTQLSSIQQLMNLFLSIAQGNTNVSSDAFKQFFQGTGPFASSNFGANGTESLLSQLQGFRDNLSNPLTGLQMPAQIQNLMSRMDLPMNMASATIGAGGQTADTMSIRDLLNTISQGQTGPQAGQQALADRILGNWGMTGSMGSALESAQSLLKNGGFNAGLENLSNVGGSIVNNRGYGPETQGAMDFFSQIMQNGGRDAGTQNLVNTGQGLVSNNGMTPEMSALFQKIQSGMLQNGMTPESSTMLSNIQHVINQGGMTPEAQQLFSKAMELVNNNGQGGALLPMNSAVNMARDQAATGAAQQAEAARRSAQQRLGSAFASGATEDTYGGLTDQALRTQAAAGQKAATDQQTLQLQQLLGAMGVGGDLTKSASGLLGSSLNAGADIVKGAQGLLGQLAGAGSDIMRSASANIGTGADLMKSGESLAATRMGQGVTGFNDTIQNALNRLKLGSDMVTNANSGATARLGLGMSGINDITNTANTAQFNASNILKSLTDQSLQAAQGLTGVTGLEFNNNQNANQTLAGLLGLGNNMFTGQQQTALSSNAQQIDALLQSMGISSNISNNFNNSWFGAANGMTNVAQLYSSLIPSGMNAYGSLSDMLIRAQMQPSFWGQLANTAVGGLFGGLTGGLGGLVSRGLGGIGKPSGRGSGSGTGTGLMT